jgi:TonB family protein
VPLLKEMARAKKKGTLATFLPLEYLTAFYEQQKQWTKAVQYSSQLVMLWRTAAGPEAVGVARFEREEAMGLAAVGEYAKAEELLSHALSILKGAPDIDAVSRAVTLADLGDVFAKEHKSADVQSSLGVAVPELEQAVGLHEPWLLAASSYEEFLKGISRKQEAAELSGRIARARSETLYMESQAFVRPKGKRLASPTYPSEAKRLRISGTVILFIEITVSGDVSNIHVLGPLGLGLDEEAARVVRTWKFEPAEDRGRIVPFFGKVEVQFNFSRIS